MINESIVDIIIDMTLIMKVYPSICSIIFEDCIICLGKSTNISLKVQSGYDADISNPKIINNIHV